MASIRTLGDAPTGIASFVQKTDFPTVLCGLGAPDGYIGAGASSLYALPGETYILFVKSDFTTGIINSPLSLYDSAGNLIPSLGGDYDRIAIPGADFLYDRLKFTWPTGLSDGLYGVSNGVIMWSPIRQACDMEAHTTFCEWGANANTNVMGYPYSDYPENYQAARLPLRIKEVGAKQNASVFEGSDGQTIVVHARMNKRYALRTAWMSVASLEALSAALFHDYFTAFAYVAGEYRPISFTPDGELSVDTSDGTLSQYDGIASINLFQSNFLAYNSLC